MLNLLGGVLKASLGAAVIPVDVIADVVTLGGALTNQEETYTEKRILQIGRALADSTED